MSVVLEVLERAADEKLDHLRFVAREIEDAKNRLKEFNKLFETNCSDIEEIADAIRAEIQREEDRYIAGIAKDSKSG